MSIYVIIAIFVGWLIFTLYQFWLVRFVYEKGYQTGKAEGFNEAKTEDRRPSPKRYGSWRNRV